MRQLPRRRQLRDGRGPQRRQHRQTDDLHCAECHQPDSGQEFDASIKGTHVLPSESTQLKGLNATIVSVTNTAPGQNPVVTFKLTENDGKVLDPKPFGSNVNVLLAGPTTDYTLWPNVRETRSTARPSTARSRSTR